MTTPPATATFKTSGLEIVRSWFDPGKGRQEYLFGRRRTAQWVEGGREMGMWWWVGAEEGLADD